MLPFGIPFCREYFITNKNNIIFFLSSSLTLSRKYFCLLPEFRFPSWKSLHSQLQTLLSPATAVWVERVRSAAGVWQVYGGCSEAWAAYQCNRNRQVRSSGKVNYTMSQSAFCYEDVQWGRWITFEGWVWLLQIEGSARVVVVVFNTLIPSRDLCQQSAACSQSTYVCVCVCVFPSKSLSHHHHQDVQGVNL